MSPLDLVVRGGTVVAPDGVRRADVGVARGRIAVVAPEVDGGAREVVDATGLHVLPGAVDAHVHLNDPGWADWEGFETGTRALAAGGTTTCADMPLNALPPTVDAAGFDAKVAAAAGRALVDFALWGGTCPATPVISRSRPPAAWSASRRSCPTPACPSSGARTTSRRTKGCSRPPLSACPSRCTPRASPSRAGSPPAPAPPGAPACATTWPRAPRSPRSRRSAAPSCSPRRPTARCTSCTSRPGVASRSSPRPAPAGSTPRARRARTTSCSTRRTPSGSARSPGARRRSARPPSATGSGPRSGTSRSSPRITRPPRPRSSARPTSSPCGAASPAPSRCSPCCSTPATTSAASRSSGSPRWPRRAPRGGCASAARGRLEPGADADLVLVDLTASTTVASETLEYRHPHSPYAGGTLRGRIERTIVRGTTVVAGGRVTAEPAGRLVTPEPTEERDR